MKHKSLPSNSLSTSGEPDSALKIGLIGVGARGATLAKNIQDSGLATVAAAFDTSATHAQHFMDLLGVKLPLAASKETILADQAIAAVVVATPDHCHVTDVCDALRAGKPVFCEKPMAITIADCDEMLRIHRETGMPLRIGFNLRFHPLYRAMHDIAATGELGRLRAVWVRHFVGMGGNFYFQDWHSRRDQANSLLLQKATHDFDVIHFVTGRFTRRVMALGQRAYYGGDRPNDLTCPVCADRYDCVEANLDPASRRRQCAFRSEIDIEDNELVMMELADGILANYAQCQFTPDYHRSYVFIGTKGRMESFEPQHRRGEYQREYRLEVLFRDQRPTRTLRFQHAVEGGHGGADLPMVIDWLRSVQHRKADPGNPVAGRQSVAVGCLAAQSLRGDNSWMTLPPLP